MSTPVNYYLGLKMGAAMNPNLVVMATSTQGSSVDVEVRIQIDNGTSTTGITRLHVLKLLEIIEANIESGGNNHDGQNLPAL